MASDDTTLKTEVRAVTDYTVAVLADADLQEVVDVAKREVAAESGVSNPDFYGDINAERALFWSTCLFCKIKAGELEGVPMSLGDMEIETIRAAGQYGSEPVIWLNNATKYVSNMNPGGRYAIGSVARDNRTYGGN